MNAMQCQVRNDIYRTAEYRGFRFDKVTVAEDGDHLSVEAWVGRKSLVRRIRFNELFSDYPGRKRQRFCEEICDQIISKDQVMSRAETLFRRCEAAAQHCFRVEGEVHVACLEMSDVPRAMRVYFGWEIGNEMASET